MYGLTPEWELDHKRQTESQYLQCFLCLSLYWWNKPSAISGPWEKCASPEHSRLMQVEQNQVWEYLKILDVHKSTGPEEIDSQMLRDMANLTASPLTGTSEGAWRIWQDPRDVNKPMPLLSWRRARRRINETTDCSASHQSSKRITLWAILQAGGQASGKQLCRKGHRHPSGHQAEYEPAMHPHSKRGQEH